jgi:hypothetical protein
MAWGKVKELEEKVTCSEVKAPDIYIEPIPRQKIAYLMEEYPTQEWLAYLVGKESDHNNFFVEDILIPPHTEASYASAEAEPFHIPENCIGVIHSHHRMGAFHSGTDQSHVDRNFPISITIAFGNGRDDSFTFDAVSHQRTPCGKPITLPCTVKYVQPPPSFDKDKFLKEAKANIDKGNRVKSLAVYYPGYGYLDEEFMARQEGAIPQTIIRKGESVVLRKSVTSIEVAALQQQVAAEFGIGITRAEAEDILLSHPNGMGWLKGE